MVNPGDQDFKHSSNELNQTHNDLPAMHSESCNANDIVQDAQASKGSNIAQKIGPRTIININLFSNIQINAKIDSQGLQGLIVVAGLIAFLAKLWWLAKLGLETSESSKLNINSDLLGVRESEIGLEVLLFSGRLRENFLLEPTLHLNRSDLDDLFTQIIRDADSASLLVAISDLSDKPDLTMVLHSLNESLEFSSKIAQANDPKGRISTQKSNGKLSNPHRKSNDTPSRKRDTPGVLGIPITQPEILDSTSIPEQPVGFIPVIVFVFGFICLKNINRRKPKKQTQSFVSLRMNGMSNKRSPSNEPSVKQQGLAAQGGTVNQSVGDKNTNSWNTMTLTFIMVIVLGGFTVLTFKFGNFSLRIEKNEPDSSKASYLIRSLSFLNPPLRNYGPILCTHFQPAKQLGYSELHMDTLKAGRQRLSG